MFGALGISPQHGGCWVPKPHVSRIKQKLAASLFMTWLWELNSIPSVTLYLLRGGENQMPSSHGKVISESVDLFKATRIGPLAKIIDISPSCISELQLRSGTSSKIRTQFY